MQRISFSIFHFSASIILYTCMYVCMYICDGVDVYIMCWGDKFAVDSYAVLLLSLTLYVKFCKFLPEIVSSSNFSPSLSLTLSLSLSLSLSLFLVIVGLESKDTSPEEHGLARQTTLILLSLHHWWANQHKQPTMKFFTSHNFPTVLQNMSLSYSIIFHSIQAVSCCWGGWCREGRFSACSPLESGMGTGKWNLETWKSANSA